MNTYGVSPSDFDHYVEVSKCTTTSNRFFELRRVYFHTILLIHDVESQSSLFS